MMHEVLQVILPVLQVITLPGEPRMLAKHGATTSGLELESCVLSDGPLMVRNQRSNEQEQLLDKILLTRYPFPKITVFSILVSDS